MNTYKVTVANITFEAQGIGDFAALRNSGIFGKEIHQVSYMRTTEGKDAWIYSVDINDGKQIAVIERI